MASAKSGRAGTSLQAISDLPCYILERNRAAAAAGLTVARQVIRDGKLTTWFVGTEAQWRASAFQHSRKKAFPQRVGATVSDNFRCFSPTGINGVVYCRLVCIGPDIYRGTIANEQLPESVAEIGDGITVYAGGYGHRAALYYIGKLETMVARKIAPAGALEHDRVHRPDWYWVGDNVGMGRSSASVILLADGRDIYCDPVGAREREAAEEAEKRKPDFKNATAMLAYWRKHAWAWLAARAIVKSGVRRLIKRRPCAAFDCRLCLHVAALRSRRGTSLR